MPESETLRLELGYPTSLLWRTKSGMNRKLSQLCPSEPFLVWKKTHDVHGTLLGQDPHLKANLSSEAGPGSVTLPLPDGEVGPESV